MTYWRILCAALPMAAVISVAAPAPVAAQSMQQSTCRGITITIRGNGNMSSSQRLTGACLASLNENELIVRRNEVEFNGETFDVAAAEEVILEEARGGVVLTVDGNVVAEISPIAELEEAAEAGDLEAQIELAVAYLEGNWVEADAARAAELFLAPAEAGNAQAQRNLAFMYFDGDGVEADRVEAMRWARLAADQGDRIGQRFLAYGLYNEEGVERDVARALELWAAAADAGDATAAFNMGIVISEGNRVAFNRERALAWFELALELGHEGAQAEIDALQASE